MSLKENLQQELKGLSQLYFNEKGRLEQLEQQKKIEETDVFLLQQERDKIELKRTILKKASEEARNQSKETLEAMATRSLQFIFGDNTSLMVELDEKANSPVAELIMKTDYGEYVVETDPAEEDGGGAGDVVSLSSLISILQLSGEDNVAPLFLDEPNKFVSKEHSENFARYVCDVSQYFKRQVFMVTHDDYIAQIGEQSYHCQIHDGKTVVTDITIKDNQ